jgi:hypothetical protein
MSDRAPFIRKAAPEADPGAVSRPIVAAIQTIYGKTVRRATPSTLASRTDEQGNIQPYAPDDPEVIERLFGIVEDDWERVI